MNSVSRGTWGILILALAVTIYVVTGRPNGAEVMLEIERQKHIEALDSLGAQMSTLRAKETALNERLAQRKDSLQTALKRASKVRIQYEKIRPITDPDSLAFALTELGYHVVLLPPGSIKDGI